MLVGVLCLVHAIALMGTLRRKAILLLPLLLLFA